MVVLLKHTTELMWQLVYMLCVCWTSSSFVYIFISNFTIFIAMVLFVRHFMGSRSYELTNIKDDNKIDEYINYASS